MRLVQDDKGTESTELYGVGGGVDYEKVDKSIR